MLRGARALTEVKPVNGRLSAVVRLGHRRRLCRVDRARVRARHRAARWRRPSRAGGASGHRRLGVRSEAEQLRDGSSDSRRTQSRAGIPAERRLGPMMDGRRAAGVAALGLFLDGVPHEPPDTLLTIPQGDTARSWSDEPSAAVSADGQSVVFASYARLAAGDVDDRVGHLRARSRQRRRHARKRDARGTHRRRLRPAGHQRRRAVSGLRLRHRPGRPASGDRGGASRQTDGRQQGHRRDGVQRSATMPGPRTPRSARMAGSSSSSRR